MSSVHDNNVKVKITESVCAFVAICMTIGRLWQRRGRYWWDDAWVFVSAICLLVQVASAFMHVDNRESLSRMGLVAAYYLMATSFYAIIWSARLSILFSIIRIDPDPRSQRRLYVIAGLFFCAILFFLAQLFWVCEPEGHVWKNLPSPQCTLTKEVAICQLVSDIVADLLLILLPVRLIRGMSDKGLKRRLYFIFSTSIVTTIVSLVHAAYILTDGTINVLISAIVEDCMSLTVANFPVVATTFLRRLAARRGDLNHTTEDEHREGTHWTSFRFRSQYLGRTTFAASRNPGATTHATSRWRGTATRGAATRLQSTTGSSTEGDSKNPLGTATFTSDYAPESKGRVALVEEHYISMGSVQQLEEPLRHVHGPATSIVR